MKKTTFFTFPLLFLICSSLLFVSCSREKRFDNWLTKSEGKWEVASASAYWEEYTYTSANDIIVDDSRVNNAISGEVEFLEDDLFRYEFEVDSLDLIFKHSGDLLLNDDSFSSYVAGEQMPDIFTKQWLSGTKISSRELDAQLRVEARYGGYLIFSVDIDMVMERVD